MKTILVPTENHDGMWSALQTALLLARRFESYVEGFAQHGGSIELPSVDILGTILLNRNITEDVTQARQIFESFMQTNNVPRSTGKDASVSFGWLDEVPRDNSFVGSYGRVFDVIVMKRPDSNSIILPNRAIESALFVSGRPILLAPPTPPKDIATNIVVAWNCSTGQTRATALAMPLLWRAKRVTVLTVNGGTQAPCPTAEQLSRCLQRNGIAAEALVVKLEGRSNGKTILETAVSLGCDLLVKGAYTQGRLRQMILGGATHHILTNATMPVLLAH